MSPLSRRKFVQSSALAAAAVASRGAWNQLAFAEPVKSGEFLSEFGHGDELLAVDLQTYRLHRTHAALMHLSDESILKRL